MNQLLQDIHYTDQQYWEFAQQCWRQGNYVALINLFKTNQNILTKFVNANWFNNLTNEVYELETNPVDNLFKQDRIQTAYLPPAELSNGGVYFEIALDNTEPITMIMGVIQAGETSIELSSTSTSSIYYKTNCLAFVKDEVVLTDVIFDNTNKTITFELNQPIDDNVLCIVYDADSMGDSNYIDADGTTNAGALPAPIPEDNDLINLRTRTRFSASDNRQVICLTDVTVNTETEEIWISITEPLGQMIYLDIPLLDSNHHSVQTKMLDNIVSTTFDMNERFIVNLSTQDIDVVLTDTKLNNPDKVIVSVTETQTTPIKTQLTFG